MGDPQRCEENVQPEVRPAHPAVDVGRASRDLDGSAAWMTGVQELSRQPLRLGWLIDHGPSDAIRPPEPTRIVYALALPAQISGIHSEAATRRIRNRRLVSS